MQSRAGHEGARKPGPRPGLPGTRLAGLAALVALATLAIGRASDTRADIIRCSFTEPFAVTTYSTNTRELTVSYDVDTTKNKIVKDLSLQILGPGVFELWSHDKQVVQRLELSYEGTDGMSDLIYPYSAHWVPENLFGGCTSNHQNRK